MAKQGTVAPKTRVNIQYIPDDGGAEAAIELPFKMLVVGDFTGRAETDAVEDRKVIGIDQNSFKKVMKKQDLGVEIAVKDRLSGSEDSDDDISVALKFAGLDDFTPDKIAKHEIFESARALREALETLSGPFANVSAFRKKIERIITDPVQREQLMNELGPATQTTPPPTPETPPEASTEA